SALTRSICSLSCSVSIFSIIFFFFYSYVHLPYLHSFPTRRSSDLLTHGQLGASNCSVVVLLNNHRIKQYLPFPQQISASSHYKFLLGRKQSLQVFLLDVFLLRNEEHEVHDKNIPYEH